MAGWDSLAALVRIEVKQREEEGCDVTGFDRKVEEAGDDEARLLQVYQELAELPVRAEFPYSEPSDLTDIRAQRPDGPRRLASEWTDDMWRDKFYGAWLGRAVGCALGKPLENLPFMLGMDGRPGWLNVKLWFEGADAWPIGGYVPNESRARQTYGMELAPWGAESVRERIRYMETDDDIRYTVLGLEMLERKGLDWDTWDVGKLWHEKLTYRQVCTAETQAYLNFARITSHSKGGRPENVREKLDWVRTYLNPYREWIGAQIRVDAYAYGAAGHPELAAELAHRDASLSHVKNGIYGAMFVAAMIAAAFVERDANRIVDIGLSEIPANCRLAHDVRKGVEIARSTDDQVELVRRLWDTFSHYHYVHTNNNAALVAASLVFADGDFEKGIATAVLGGWDTDCNGATVGSILGAQIGAAKLPRKWTEPLQDTLYAEIPGYHPIAISECARRSYEVFKKLQSR
ncbi:ADP-ribosylglycohydrolase family protein [Paenibacillus thermoaerophilus]|uniref:ADP-ribosylglycohydrolase family protein n=1 Tax=Paenibacillus thermoaerophilus TaxID=1215385 RepID=A0ABW2V3R1_9BACL|nr:ADP-ribosylglycohydrolase family protein [Paenibacillus thermoaerophilus]TMV17185.1 ADP-ribosylglycohydrolase family protein [Paenibacillus thermoaerophilus]